MTLHLSLPGTHRSSQQQQEELREARRVLKEKIRNDWEYPTLPAHRSSGAERSNASRREDAVDEEEERIAGFRFHAPTSSNPAAGHANRHVFGLDFDPTEWREREEASETEGESSSATNIPPGHFISSKRKSKDSSSAVYQFEGPDSVATQLQERRSARKRKRNEALREEMQWNKGLELYIHRRDQWSCARPATEVRMAERESTIASAAAAEQQMAAMGLAKPTTTTTTTTGSTASSSPRTSTSSTSSAASSTTAQISSTLSTPATTPSSSATADSMATTSTNTSPLPSLLIPVAPSLLPNHPIRRRISPSTYPEIYSKIILQSRTPSVPINLSTLIKALVQGWKDDGEWPPKPAGILEPSLGRRKKKGGGGEGGGGGGVGGLRHGIKRVLRVTGVVDSGRRDSGG